MTKMTNQQMVRNLLFLIIAFFLTTYSFGEKLSDLPEANNPHFMKIAGTRLFVIDNAEKIHIYELQKNNVKHIKTFGKRGQGPGEFTGIHRLFIKDKHIEVPTMGKYIHFSLDGDYLDEDKLIFMVFKSNLYKIEKNYLTKWPRLDKKKLYVQIKLFGPKDQDNKEIENREIHTGFDNMNIATPYYSLGIYKNMFYTIYSDQETILKYYDEKGKFINEIKIALKPEPITAKLRQKVETNFRGDMKEARWKTFQEVLYCPKNTPGLNYFEIFDHMMVARTYRFKDDKAEFVFFDMKGKELKRMYLYYSGRTSSETPFCFHKDYFYYLKENTETETWELFSEIIFLPL